MHVLFLCTGATCRSPAAGLLLRAARPDWTATARGTRVRAPGAPVDPRMARLLRARGLDPSGHAARQAAEADLDAADLVLACEEGNRLWAEALRPGLARLLLEAAGTGEGDVADPYEGGDYGTAFATLDAAVAALARRP